MNYEQSSRVTRLGMFWILDGIEIMPTSCCIVVIRLSLTQIAVSWHTAVRFITQISIPNQPRLALTSWLWLSWIWLATKDLTTLLNTTIIHRVVITVYGVVANEKKYKMSIVKLFLSIQSATWLENICSLSSPFRLTSSNNSEDKVYVYHML